MLKKFTNKKGFTLMEMLIVVAIIAILVAIAIPTFAGQLENARQATDVANIRAAYAEANVKYLSGGTGEATTPALKSKDFSKLDTDTKIGEKSLSDIKTEATNPAKGDKITVTVDESGAKYKKG